MGGTSRSTALHTGSLLPSILGRTSSPLHVRVSLMSPGYPFKTPILPSSSCLSPTTLPSIPIRIFTPSSSLHLSSTELKNRLVELLTPSILDKCTGILWGAELGGRRPTELLEVMMAALPSDEQATSSRRSSSTASWRTSRTWWPSSSTSWR